MNLLPSRGYASRSLEEQIARTDPDIVKTIFFRFLARRIINYGSSVSLNRRSMRLTLAYLYEAAMPSMQQAANGAIRRYRGTLRLGRSREPDFVPNLSWVERAGACFVAIEGVLFVNGLAMAALTGAGSAFLYVNTQGRSFMASMTVANLGWQHGTWGVAAGIGINLLNNGGDINGALTNFGAMVALNMAAGPIARFALKQYDKRSEAAEKEREREADAAYDDVTATNSSSFTDMDGVTHKSSVVARGRRRRAVSHPGNAQAPPPASLVERSVDAIYGFFDYMANERRRLVPLIVAGCWILFISQLFLLVTDSFVGTQREITRGPKTDALLTASEHATLKSHRARRVLARLSHF
jgi:hypothetical protein